MRLERPVDVKELGEAQNSCVHARGWFTTLATDHLQSFLKHIHTSVWRQSNLVDLRWGGLLSVVFKNSPHGSGTA